MTPWRMPERMRFLRERAAREASARSLKLLLDDERLRQEAARRAGSAASVATLDLCDPDDVLEAAGLPQDRVFWPPTDARSVSDQSSAARFWVDTLRRRKDLRDRFPRAFSPPADNSLAEWLHSRQGQEDLALTPEGAEQLVALLSADFAERARQFFLASEDVRAVMPHGLLPSGRRGLFRWFMQHGLEAGDLALEEVWWLFLQAQENPQGELVRAFLFTAQWQQDFPDALTVFGWSRFSDWVATAYGVDRIPTGLIAIDHFARPALQVRTGYLAHTAWRLAHPDALSNVSAARALLEWLASGEHVPLASEARSWCAALDVEALAPELLDDGVNLIGHFCYPSGLRVSVEAMTKALGLAGIRTSLRDVRTDVRDDPRHVCFDGLESSDITIIHVQPEPFFERAYTRADLAQRMPRTYRIAYWYWEFDSIPQAWCAYANQVDEVWTATEFIAKGLRERLSVPVRTLFPGVTLAPFQARDRAHFNLDKNRFTFLFTFHMVSVMERKNPLGLIRAFKTAFRDDESVTLVLKTSFGDRHPVQFQELRDAAADSPAIRIIDEVLSSDEVLSLMNACDAYVSLHRCEGLGLTMAEAMLMGKPVIATAFSGNMDFMNDENSLLVPYERVKVGRLIPPYGADMEWAEPSVEDAARLMRRLYEDPQWARQMGARGRQSAEADLSLHSAGRRMAGRIEEIRALLRRAPRA
ncbi:glycosyltransferase family 4 protein [Variovorax sp. CAN2819]|uniref:glycosyltransferase family 4 protein n=1 Tax=Variovorax sp. CAN15 TaxID=3046727 RepID=UPI002649F369|nr:glycosyltransferase family 4 protein [Variovorax sp. CAN15]MDN6885963.1 glycosyltransferase family 4 protein [Variovorax sp. CAN15]